MEVHHEFQASRKIWPAGAGAEFWHGDLGGGNDFFKAWGSTDTSGAARLIDVCLEHGVSMFDTADVYSDGLAEQILGEAIKGKRNRLLISTKVTFPTGQGPNDYGSSRQHIIEAVNKSLQRLQVEHIDLLQLHDQDYNTPVEETLSTLDQLVREGKVRYVGASNFSGWHLMKSWRPRSAMAIRVTWRIRFTTRCSTATMSGNWRRWRKTRAWAPWSGVRWAGAN
jgi:aryl-alcohol dehydrogenase-like predicted oxidoreductase